MRWKIPTIQGYIYYLLKKMDIYSKIMVKIVEFLYFLVDGS